MFELNNKIRTNEKLGEFILTLFDINRPPKEYDKDNVDVYFAKDINMARHIIKKKQRDDFKFINFTPSLHYSAEWDNLPHDFTTHGVLGQEFDNVLVVIGNEFKYINGVLEGRKHPSPDLIYYQLLYQSVTRARKKLCVIIYENLDVFSQLLTRLHGD